MSTDETLLTSSAGSVTTSGSRQNRTRIGRYKLHRLIGAGGVGEVYEATDTELNRRVAVKLLRTSSSSDPEQIRREARALARLVHPNVVTIHDVGGEDGELFLVMQMIDGVTIDRWLAKREAPPDEIVAAFRSAGLGLVAAHAAGLVHCDFKPANVLVDAQGNVRVGDFGLARRVRTTGRTSVAQLNSPTSTIPPEGGASMSLRIAGTPAYMAPEQFDGVITAASDQFSFCVSLWECLTGERPFENATLDTPRGPRQALRQGRVPRYLRPVLERGMAENPAERYPSMAKLVEALAPPRRRTAVVLGLAAACALASGGSVYLLSRDAPPVPWDAADLANQHALTLFGSNGCAYAPTVEDGGDVVFDLTVGDQVDLYATSLAPGATPRRLTSAPTQEWRANHGRRTGEVVHLIHDRDHHQPPRIAYLDLATGAETLAIERLAWDAVYTGGALYYSPDEPAGLRVLDDKGDRSFIEPSSGRGYFLLSASPLGGKLATIDRAVNDGPSYPCVVDLASARVRCFDTESSTARPAFGADGHALYFDATDGIRRHDLDTGEETLVVPGVFGEGGLAVARYGSALVYSTCTTRSKILDTAGKTPAVLVDDNAANEPVVSPTGALAWVRETPKQRTLLVRAPGGATAGDEVTDASFGSIRAPAFSPDGKMVVFSASGAHDGLYTAKLGQPGVMRQLTGDPRDGNAAWTASGLIGFTRITEDGNMRPYTVPAAGGEVKPLGTSSRLIYGALGNELLADGLAGTDTAQLVWIDATTGHERPGPPAPPGYLTFVSLSPNGKWIALQMGELGQDIWRARLDPPGELQHVLSYGAGMTLSHIAISDEGHVIAAPQKWEGDLMVIPAKPGQAF